MCQLRARETIFAFLKRFRGDESGVVSILGAMFILFALVLGTIVVDAGHLYLAKRRLQTVVDASALAAATNPRTADMVVRAYLAREGYDGDDLVVEAGAYTADPSVAVANRFDGDLNSVHNAVRVKKSIVAPGFFSRIFYRDSEAVISASATATRMPVVSFSTGSGLIGLSAGELNRTLGALLGTTLNLTLMDYNGLAETNIDALGMLDSLATHVGLSAGTYGDLANADISVGQFIAAAQATLNLHPGATTAAAAQALNLLSLKTPQGVSARLGDFFNTALWKSRRIGSVVQQVPGQTTVNLFEAITAMARLYGGSHIVDIGAGLALPITNTSIEAYLAAGEPLASLSAASVGSGLTTSQLRLALIVTAANINLGIASATVRIPIYIEGARGEASVSAVQCQQNGTMTTISARPAAVIARIGNVTPDDINDYGFAPLPEAASIVSLKVLGIPIAIEADATSSVASGPASPLDFTANEIAAGTVKSLGGDTSHLLSNLTQTLDLRIRGSGLTQIINGIVSGTVMPLLRPLVRSILMSLDPVVGSLLRSSGLRLGIVNVGVHTVSCGHSTLVE